VVALEGVFLVTSRSVGIPGSPSNQLTDRVLTLLARVLFCVFPGGRTSMAYSLTARSSLRTAGVFL